MKTYIRPLRTALLTVLLATDGEPFSAETMIRNASTFITNAGMIGTSHYVQVDLAWAKARRAKGLWDHDHKHAPTPATGDSAAPLLWLGMMLTGLTGLFGLARSARNKKARKR